MSQARMKICKRDGTSYLIKGGKLMYAVGIEVSKGKSTVSIITTEGEVIEEPF